MFEDKDITQEDKIMEDLKAYTDAPEDVKAILNSFDFDGDAYKECDRLLDELEPLGYSFDYGLDGEPYNLYKTK